MTSVEVNVIRNKDPAESEEGDTFCNQYRLHIVSFESSYSVVSIIINERRDQLIVINHAPHKWLTDHGLSLTRIN